MYLCSALLSWAKFSLWMDTDSDVGDATELHNTCDVLCVVSLGGRSVVPSLPPSVPPSHSITHTLSPSLKPAHKQAKWKAGGFKKPTYPWPASSRPPAGPPEARPHPSNLQPSLSPSAAAARRSSRHRYANRHAPSATEPAVKAVSTVCFVIGVGSLRAAQTANRQRGLHWTSIPMPTSAIPAQTPKWQNPTTELCITTTVHVRLK